MAGQKEEDVGVRVADLRWHPSSSEASLRHRFLPAEETDALERGILNGLRRGVKLATSLGVDVVICFHIDCHRLLA